MTPATERRPPPVLRLAAVDSTQTVAFALAAEGAPDGTVVVADVQLAGRGRRGRSWIAAPGTSLLVSLLVRPRLPLAEQPLYSFAAAVAVAEAVAALAGETPTLRWPNDVLLGGRKVAGILLEGRASPAPVVVVGIGLNLHQCGFAGGLRSPATSIALATGRHVDRDVALGAVRAAFDRWRDCLERDGFAPVRGQWRARSSTLGRVVSLDGVTGTAVDIAEDGALIVAADGREWRLTAGEVDETPATRDAPRR